MPLAAGERLGPYEILAPIGVGGMGEVYKARDTRLDRLVAIKVSKKNFSDRFEREARAVAQLNHPHICALYDVGPNYLVMEYVEGTALKGSLPAEKAVEYGGQILDALDAAHQKHITHRDLKPANILLTKQGVKLLDFGLAKLAREPISESDETLTQGLTQEGQIAGTLQYMSPEQLNGKEVDPRSDLFSFGCVLYEMLTGRRAFRGSSAASVIAAILEREPEPLNAAPSLERVVQRALAKDPDQRFQTARDLKAALSWALEHVPATTAGGRSRLRIAAAAATVLAVIAIAVSWMAWRGAPQAPLTRLDVVTPPTSDPFAFALSPDGRQLVFSAPSDGVAKLWLRPLDQAEAKPLPGTDSASAPFWSPDGRSIGFFADGKLKRLDLGASVSQVLATAPDGRGGTWEIGGTIVFTPTTASPLLRVPASGGTPMLATKLDPTHEISHRWPQALPDGRLIFFVLSFGNVQPSGIYLASPNGSGSKRLVSAGSGAAYAPPGYLLLADQGVLVARSLDLRIGSVGAPVPIAQPIGTDSTVWRSAFSVSNAGVLAHRTVSSARRQLVWVDRAGNRLGSVGDIDENIQLTPALSPDGHRVAVQRAALGAPHTWIFENGRDVPIRFRQDAAPDARVVWTPDGQRLAFLTAIDGRQALVEKPLAGTARDERVLVPSGFGLEPLDYSEDGRYFLYSTSDDKTGWDIWALPLQEGGKAFPVLQTSFNEELGQLSRDGKWIAYQSNESGRTEVYIRPFLRQGAAVSVSSGGGIAPEWRRDGKELFYVAPDGALISVALQGSPDHQALEPTARTRLFRVSMVGGGSMLIGGMQQYAVAPDGQRFLINLTVSEANAPITVVLNWPAALKK